MVSVSVGPARTSPWGQLDSNGRQAPCEAVTLGCVSTAGSTTSGNIHQHAARTRMACVVNSGRACAVHKLVLTNIGILVCPILRNQLLSVLNPTEMNENQPKGPWTYRSRGATGSLG